MAKSVDKAGNIKPGEYRDSNNGAKIENLELIKPQARSGGRKRKTVTVQLKKLR